MSKNIAELPVIELVTMTERADDLSLSTVRQLLSIEPQVAVLLDRLRLVKQSLAVATPAPPVVVPSIQHEVTSFTAIPATPEPRKERWTLVEDDIKPGIIAWFDSDTLNTDPHVVKPHQFENRVMARPKGGRPAICIEADDEESQWATLTTNYRQEYFKLKPEWFTPRGALNSTSYVPGYVYRGPHNSFCVAAAQVEFDLPRRPRISAIGLKAVMAFLDGREEDV